MTTVKFGYWTVKVDEETTNPLLKHRFYCSECGNWQSYGRTLFCPNCGAKMAMTNADRIRAMTDEELTKLFNCEIDGCPPDTQLVARCSYYADATLCHSCWLNWLKMEVKDG